MKETNEPGGIRLAGRPREECGVCAVTGHGEAAKLTYLGLYALQHRGQETAGIVSAFINPEGKWRHRAHRGLGLVADVFTREILESLKGRVAIGHVRYSTTGAPIPSNTQPVAASLRLGPMALAHNGNLTNAHTLRRNLKARGAIFQTSVDTEVLLHLTSRAEGENFEDCLIAALRQVRGAYSLVVLHGETLYAVRDPYGFRPLALGRLPGGAWAVASESVAFDLLNAALVRDIEPGEIVRIDPGTTAEPVSLRPFDPVAPARCIFEHIYFSRPDSIVDGHSVQRMRERMGTELWREHPAEADVVIPVPDSSNAAAMGFARAGRLSFEMGLIRSHYIGRTFIEPSQRIRDFGAKIKYNPVRAVVSGRRVVVIDDSIIRGTTSKKIVRMLRQAGATEIHMRITAPPWRNPCQYGIDTPDPSRFVATGREVEEIREELGCDSIGYLSPEGLKRASKEMEGWCMACFTGHYPDGQYEALTKSMLADDDSVSSAHEEIARARAGRGGEEPYGY